MEIMVQDLNGYLNLILVYMSNCYDPPGYPCGGGGTGPCDPDSTTLLQLRTKKINKQVRMPSSQMILRKRGMNVTQWLAEGEYNLDLAPSPYNMNAGGRGDFVPSVQVSIRAGIKGNKARIIRRGPTGVDKKHDSYARYLARRVGKVLRQETATAVAGRTAIVGQPINRTLTKATYALQARRTSGTATATGGANDDCCQIATDANSKGRQPAVA